MKDVRELLERATQAITDLYGLLAHSPCHVPDNEYHKVTNAAALTEELQAALASIQEEWVPVGERLPMIQERVWVAAKDGSGRVHVGHSWHDGNGRWASESFSTYFYEITHWKEYVEPAPPEVKL